MSTTKSPVHLKPGEIVQHPDKGRGLVTLGIFSRNLRIVYTLSDGTDEIDDAPGGWERVETVRPGHVQVRVDDLDLSGWEISDDSKGGGWSDRTRAVIRVAKALAAQDAESTPPADAESELPPVLWDRHNVKWERDEGELYVGGGDRSTPDSAMRYAHLERLRGPLTESPRAESAPPADEKPPTVGDGCECWVTPQHTWTTHYGAVEPGSQTQYNPDCPKHGTPPAESHTEPATAETVTDSGAPKLTTPVVSDVRFREDDDQPVDATVSLPCPQCGEDITAGAAVERCGDGWSIVYPVSAPQPGEPDHRCEPAQPDEPTEFGARVTVTRPDGTREPWLRFDKHTKRPWVSEAVISERSWNQVKQRGTVTLGWGD